MIVLGNNELVLGMKFCGIKTSYAVSTRQEVLEIIKDLSKDEMIMVNASILEKVPELKEFPNLASLPDNVDNFDNVDDLKYIVKSAIGVELEGL